MTDRFFWYSNNCLKSVYLSKNRCDTITNIPTIHKIKINVFFSKRLVRSTILTFYFLFFIFGHQIVNKTIQNPSKKLVGLGTKQVFLGLDFYSPFTLWAFLDYWVNGAAHTNLIYLKKRTIMETSMCLSYSTIPRPKRLQIINYFDKGCDYYLTKVGCFDFTVNYKIQKSNLQTSIEPAGLFEDTDETYYFEDTDRDLHEKGLTEEAINFYCLSLNL